MTTLLIAAWVVWVPMCVVCFLKGKPWLGLLGLLTGLIAASIGAARLALPDSWWARHFYDARKLALSRARYGDERPRELSQMPVGWE